MNVFLVSPNEKDFLYSAGDRPPLGLLYLSTSLEKEGIENEIFDLNHFKESELVERIMSDKPDFVGVSVPSSPSFSRMKEFSYKIKDYSKLIFGGPHISAMPKSVEDIATSVVIGYGEKGILEALKGRTGIIHSPSQFNECPIPNRKKVNSKNYSLNIKGLNGTTMISSRGCPFGCVFCASHEKIVQFRNLESIEIELNEINNLGYKAVYVLDENFLNDKNLYEKIKLFNNQDIKYKIEGRTNNITPKLAESLRKTGCLEISLGIESGNDEILKRINKRTTVEGNKKAIKILGETGVDVKGFFILGLPGETKETARETIRFAEEMKEKGLTSADFYVLTPFPGSEIWDSPEKFGIKILSRSFNEYLQKGDPVIETEKLNQEEIKELLIEARERWKK